MANPNTNRVVDARSEDEGTSLLLSQVVVENRRLWRSPARRMLLLKWILCAALLIAMALSPHLWSADRGFPVIPLQQGTPDLPQVATLAIVFAFVIFVGATAICPSPGWFSGILVVSAGLLVYFDIDRLQPWFYQYVLMLAILGGMDWRDPESRRGRGVWAASAVVVIGLYFWSGIQKANLAFAHQVFPWLLRFDSGPSFVRNLWFLVPAAEALTGLSLLWPRTRNLGLAGVAVMHAFVLFTLGPFDRNFNSVVWPWNLAMAAMAFTLFAGDNTPIFRNVVSNWRGRIACLLSGLLPALNFFGWWDSYLSASLYSGKVPFAWIYLSAEGLKALPASYREGNPAITEVSPGQYAIDVNNWGIAELNVPPYPESRVLETLCRKVSAELPAGQARGVLQIPIGRFGDATEIRFLGGEASDL